MRWEPRVRVCCPKISIQVETGLPIHFQVTMHTPESGMLAVSHQYRQLHSGTGPIILEVSFEIPPPPKFSFTALVGLLFPFPP